MLAVSCSPFFGAGTPSKAASRLANLLTRFVAQMKTAKLLPFAMIYALFCLFANVALTCTIWTWDITGIRNDFTHRIEAEIKPNLAKSTFRRADGEKFAVNFFRMWDNEADFKVRHRAPPLKRSRPEMIIANNIFTGLFTPQHGTGTINGLTSGGARFDRLDRDNLEDHFILSDGTFSVPLGALSRFNEREFTRGKDNGAVVRAETTQPTRGPSPNAVPDTGSTALLLLLGFVALAFAARGRLTANAT
jgi:hypothetical protein